MVTRVNFPHGIFSSTPESEFSVLDTFVLCPIKLGVQSDRFSPVFTTKRGVGHSLLRWLDPSGKREQFANLKPWPLRKFVDLAMKMVIFHCFFCKRFPEGTPTTDLLILALLERAEFWCEEFWCISTMFFGFLSHRGTRVPLFIDGIFPETMHPTIWGYPMAMETSIYHHNISCPWRNLMCMYIYICNIIL